MAEKPSAKKGGKGSGESGGTGRRRGRMARLSRTASNLVSRAARAKGFAEAEVVTRWAHIVGPELAQASVPLKLQFPRGERRGATLVVRTESAFAPLLQHRAPGIIELVNRYLGYGAVDKLQVRQGPLPAKTVRAPKEKQPLAAAEQARLNALVGDGELTPLKDAIKSLGEYVLGDKDKKQGG